MGKNATKIFATNCKNGQKLPKINLFLSKLKINLAETLHTCSYTHRGGGDSVKTV